MYSSSFVRKQSQTFRSVVCSPYHERMIYVFMLGHDPSDGAERSSIAVEGLDESRIPDHQIATRLLTHEVDVVEARVLVTAAHHCNQTIT